MSALLSLLGFTAFLIFALWIVQRFHEQRAQFRRLQMRLDQLETELRTRSVQPTLPPPSPVSRENIFSEKPAPSISSVPPPLPPMPPVSPASAVPPPPEASLAAKASPPPLVPPKAISSRKPAMNWEQFMGVKLFAWLGGLALFLSAVFFIKLSIEEGWISPELRVGLGFALGVGLVVGGLIVSGKRFAVTAQTFCATGLVTLYAMTFAARSVYGFFSAGFTYGLMILITALAFGLALRLQARVVAVLGLLGGFLTPVLLSTGQENARGLFSYIAFLDTGLLAVALASGWNFLIPLAALGTIAMEASWNVRFLRVDTAETVAAVAAFFDFLFLIGAAVARRLRKLAAAYTLPVAALSLFTFIVAWDLGLDLAPALSTGQWLGLVFFADLCVLAVIALGEDKFYLNILSGLAVFSMLGAWTMERLSPDLLTWAFGAYLFFALIHGVFPLLLRRWFPERRLNAGGEFFPVLSLILLIAPTFERLGGSTLLWPVVLILDGLALGLAVRSRSVWSTIFALILTFVLVGLAFMRAYDRESPDTLFFAVVGFALFFFAAGSWNALRPSASPSSAPKSSLPIWATLFPFALLLMVTQRVEIQSPNALFGVVLVLCGMAGICAYFLEATSMPLIALGGVGLVAEGWQLTLSPPINASTPLVWYAGFYLLFTLFPFVGYRRFLSARGPWLASAFSGGVFFWLTYSLLAKAWPEQKLGWLAALFAAGPAVIAYTVSRRESSESPERLERMALFAGASACFVALIFPIQFERQWITSGWSLEGIALLWLFRRWPHRLLSTLGVFLLAAAFWKLAFSPAVWNHPLHQRVPIFNDYFVSYGLAVVCLVVGSRLATPALRVFNWRIAPIFSVLAGILLFLLINLEIADYFTRRSNHLFYRFSENFARDMTYTVAWATYALALLVLGIWRHLRGCRYAAIALLAVTLCKLFFFDLARLEQLYRIGALVGVALAAILASVLYQRFVPDTEKSDPPEPPLPSS